MHRNGTNTVKRKKWNNILETNVNQMGLYFRENRLLIFNGNVSLQFKIFVFKFLLFSYISKHPNKF